MLHMPNACEVGETEL